MNRSERRSEERLRRRMVRTKEKQKAWAEAPPHAHSHVVKAPRFGNKYRRGRGVVPARRRGRAE